MRIRAVIAFFTCVSVVAVTACVAAAPSAAAGRVTLDRPRIEADAVLLKGSAPAGARVRIVRSTRDGWKRVAADDATLLGRYRVWIPRPERRAWTVRAVSQGMSSEKRRIPRQPTVEEPPPVVPPPPDACGARLQKEDGTLWECTFVDDFNGATIDTGKWLAQSTSLSGVTNGTSCYIGNKPEVISLADGTLKLSAIHLDAPFTCKSPYGDFSTDRASATLTTKGRFSQILGRFAFRAKFPTTRVQGAHPALWLFPDGQRYGRWPLSGEIDVVEWYSALPEKVYPSVHYVDGLNDVHSGQNGTFADVSDWHTYVVEWNADTMRFIYDGDLIWEHQWAALAPLIGTQPFDQPFNAVVTQAWGGLWNAPTDATPDRVTTTVDWVRVWK